jgi:hypothetical protein
MLATAWKISDHQYSNLLDCELLHLKILLLSFDFWWENKILQISNWNRKRKFTVPLLLKLKQFEWNKVNLLNLLRHCLFFKAFPQNPQRKVRTSEWDLMCSFRLDLTWNNCKGKTQLKVICAYFSSMKHLTIEDENRA